ncbi:MAG: NHLP leader peptide family natural product precursor [Bryobacteraceae bacterium]|nr:NHLP leader peptide family natural product precursor [Bryobacteraceae bacterium]
MSESLKNVWPQIVGQAWADPDFYARLVETPHLVLQDFGINVPAGHRIEMVEDTPYTTYLVLPLKPAHLGSSSLLMDGDEKPMCSVAPDEDDPALLCSHHPEEPMCSAAPDREDPFMCSYNPDPGTKTGQQSSSAERYSSRA